MDYNPQRTLRKILRSLQLIQDSKLSLIELK